MEFNYIKFSIINKCGYITLNNPKTLNALTSGFLQEIYNVIIGLYDSEIKCLVINSSSEKAFVAGADISEMVAFTSSQAVEYSQFGKKVFDAIENLPVPTISLISGYALGGGCELSLACDIRLASKKSKFGFPEVGLGIFPGFDGIRRLKRIINESQAKLLTLTGKIIDSDYAVSIGLIDSLFDDDVFDKETKLIIDCIINQPKQSLCNIKKVFRLLDVNSSFDDSNLFGECFETEEQVVRMNRFLKR